MASEDQQRKFQEFLYTLTHDLKAPLISIEGFVKLLAEEGSKADPEDVRLYLNRILANVDGMRSMIDNLRHFFQLENLTPRDLNKERISAEHLNRWTKEWSTKKNKENPQIPPQDFLKNDLHLQKAEGFSGDPKWLEILWRALLDNALKFSDPQNPQVRICAKMKNDKMFLKVENNGIEIPKEEQQKVFQFLFRGKLQAQGKQGSGMGLALAQKITELHHAKIWIEINSEKKKGTGTNLCLLFPA